MTCRTLLVLLSLASFAAPAFSAERVALVIGNGDYANTAKLGNPSNDASDVAAALREFGFCASGVRFVIEEVYPGSRYTDTAISKLSVASERAP